MLKMYQAQMSRGSSPEFWDANWDSSAADLSDPRTCENDPCHALIMSHARPDRLFLEGGCGSGQWVKYLHDRAYRVVGVDFAPRIVDKLHRAIPNADVRVGDVCALPFADGEVHTYYSGGVVEHFETGPEPALREARRVLAPDGWFLCSVPDQSFLRDRVLYRSSTTEREIERPFAVHRVTDTRKEDPPTGMQFFQYAFSREEFRSKLEQAGFRVVDSFGYSLVWGLMEIPHFEEVYQTALRTAKALRARIAQVNSFSVRRSGNAADIGQAERAPVPSRGRLTEWLVRTMVREDRSTPFAGAAVRFALEHCANMRMYIARPSN